MAIDFKPKGSRVVILPDPKEEMRNGLYLPQDAQEKPQKGTVVAVGDGRVLPTGVRFPVDFQVGDRVYFSKYGGQELKLDDKEYVVMEEESVLGSFAPKVDINAPDNGLIQEPATAETEALLFDRQPSIAETGVMPGIASGVYNVGDKITGRDSAGYPTKDPS